MRFTLIVSLLLSILAVIFALLNNDDTIVNFGFTTTRGPLALILILTFVSGVVTGLLAMVPSRFRSRQQVKTLKKQLHQECTPPAPSDTAMLEPTASADDFAPPPPPPHDDYSPRETF